MDVVYEKVRDFKNRYPLTIAWRLKAHSKVAQEHINSDEEVLYAFAAQKGYSFFNIASTFVIVLTDKRLVLAQKRLFFGYYYYAITPDMFNDLTLKMGIIWGKVIIDTIKETVSLNLLSKGALKEIETVLSKYMMQEKRNYKTPTTPKEQQDLESEIENISENGER
jgi:hypothetical protein